MRKSETYQAEAVCKADHSLEEVGAGAVAEDLRRKYGMSSATYHVWEAKFGGLEVSDAKRLRSPEGKNARPKRLRADVILDSTGLKDPRSKDGSTRREAAGCRAFPGDVGDERAAE